MRDWLDWIITNSKNITYFAVGAAIVWAIPYCIIYMKDIPAGVLAAIGIVYGIGAVRAGNQAYQDAKVEVAKAENKVEPGAENAPSGE